jgi:electron transport complex protein RnfG
MAKLESNFRNMVLVLFLVTFIASGALGFVYELTKEPIRLVEITNKNAAINEVITNFENTEPLFDNAPFIEMFKVPSDKDSLTFYPAMNQGKYIGMAVETYTMLGFSGEIKLMVGFDMTGNIMNIAVLSHSETPGLGDKIENEKSDFSKQFRGINPDNFILKVKKDNGDVDAITASTISSRAYCDAVQRAYNAFILEKTQLETE